MYGPVPLLESVAVTVKSKLPPDVGVPLNAPPAESATPGGREPPVTASEYGAVPPLAESDSLYG